MKKFLSSLGLSLLLLFFSFGLAFADVPEKDGVYDVPGRSNLRVRVFVHEPKPVSVLPSLVCSSDPESQSIVGPAGWRLPSGVWNYRLNLGSVPGSVGSANIATISAQAFGYWSDATSGKVAFNNAGTTSASRANLDGQNIIAWGRTQGTALGVTYTWYYKSTGLAVETDTIMNKKFKWSWTPYTANACGVANTYDAQNILTHEFGHWLGMNDEYTGAFVDNTMYGYGSPAEVKKDTLTVGDVLGVSTLYQ